jgi:hypothetical protein
VTWADIRAGATASAAGSTGQVQFNSGGNLGASSGLVFTSAGRLGIGTASPVADKLQVEDATYTSNLLVIHNGEQGTPPAYPKIEGLGIPIMPMRAVHSSETNYGWLLWLGYNNGSGGWDASLGAGACGSLNGMCLDIGGTGATLGTALENSGTTLQNGGGDDGNFINIQFINTGNVGIGTPTPGTALDVNGGVTMEPTAVTLTANNTVLATANRSYVRVTSDNTTETNQIFCFGAGTLGQVLVIEWTSATGRGEIVSHGNCSGAAGAVTASLSFTNWASHNAETILQFMYNGTHWIQITGSANY